MVYNSKISCSSGYTRSDYTGVSERKTLFLLSHVPWNISQIRCDAGIIEVTKPTYCHTDVRTPRSLQGYMHNGSVFSVKYHTLTFSHIFK